MKNYNLSEIAKEYATKNQCGLPLTPEQLLNSVVVYVNEEVSDVVNSKKYYAHYVTWIINDAGGGRMYCTIISDKQYAGSASYYIEWLHTNLLSEETGHRLQATGFRGNKVVTGVRAQGTNALNIEYFNPAINNIERIEYNVNQLIAQAVVRPIN